MKKSDVLKLYAKYIHDLSVMENPLAQKIVADMKADCVQFFPKRKGKKDDMSKL
jgi:hypothetical protein